MLYRSKFNNEFQEIVTQLAIEDRVQTKLQDALMKFEKLSQPSEVPKKCKAKSEEILDEL